MIEQYWNEMFGKFKTGERQFSLPGFPEPLMSPYFGTFNIVGEKPKGVCRSFVLCGFDPIRSPKKIQVTPLAEVIKDEAFWDYQTTYVPETVTFMRRLLPFLVKLEKLHYFFSVLEGEETVATAFGGEGDTKCFLFNLKVRDEFQKRGMARKLLEGARGHFQNKDTFYWTVHPTFTMGAPYVEGYHISY